MATSNAISRFADAHGLSYAGRAHLPSGTTLLDEKGILGGPGAVGDLTAGLRGTLAHHTYETRDSEGTTRRHEFTLVVTAIPESIGFLPFIGISGPRSDRRLSIHRVRPARELKLGNDPRLASFHARVFDGTDERWLRELFSPKVIDRLARMPEDLSVELAGGVLCVARTEHLRDQDDLGDLCETAGFIAERIRGEVIEEGGRVGQAAKRVVKTPDRVMEHRLRSIELPSPLEHVHQAAPILRSRIIRTFSHWSSAMVGAFWLLLILNVPGVAVPIVLIDAGAFGWLAAIEGALLAGLTVLVSRWSLETEATRTSEEAFFRNYAAERDLVLVDALTFKAAHVDPPLPFDPDRVLRGVLPGGFDGSLVTAGIGEQPQDRVAFVDAETGLAAEAGLRSEPPGLLASDLDVYAEELGSELRG